MCGWNAPPKASGQDTLMVRSIRPEVGISAPLMRRISVDLPAPLRPRMPTLRPRPSSKLTSSSTVWGPWRVE